MKGIIVFYVNVEDAENETDYLKIAKSVNSSLLERLTAAGYEAMFVPVTNESCRVEKVDFDLPFPRYLLPHVDILENDKMMSEIKDRANEKIEEGDEE